MMKKHLILLAVIYWGCTPAKQKMQPENVLAQVGDYTISENEFLLNYQFGFPQNKQGETPERAYLQKMINELLIAQHGFEMKLDTAASIQYAIRTISQESLIEKVFDTHVTNQIVVTDNEIKAEINKAAVSFQLKYLPAQSQAHAHLLKAQAEAQGFDAVSASLMNEMQTGALSENDFETPYMSSEEIDPQLLELVQNLELQTLSEPVQYNGQWFLFMVNNIRRKPIAPEDYAQKHETYRKVVYNRKAMQMAEVFVGDLMNPLHVRTRREVFNSLSSALYDWMYTEIPNGNLVNTVRTKNTSYLRKIDEILDDELVSWSEGAWTVEQFLEHFNPARHQLRTGDPQQFTLVFSDVIALTVRDYYLMEMGEKEGLDTSDEVQKEVQQWANKWVFQSARERYLNQLDFSDAIVQAYYQRVSDTYAFNKEETKPYAELTDAVKRRVRKEYLAHMLQQYADSLAGEVPVYINEEKLADISARMQTSAPDIPTQLFKQNSNRMALPVVDPNW